MPVFVHFIALVGLGLLLLALTFGASAFATTKAPAHSN
jgi:hypothetical protein